MLEILWTSPKSDLLSLGLQNYVFFKPILGDESGFYPQSREEGHSKEHNALVVGHGLKKQNVFYLFGFCCRTTRNLLYADECHESAREYNI